MRLRNLLIILGTIVIVAAVFFYIYYPKINADQKISVPTITLSVSLDDIRADGLEQSTITAILPCGKVSFIDTEVNFTTTLGKIASPIVKTDNTCKASAKISSSVIGSATIIATSSGGAAAAQVNFMAVK